MKGQMLLDRFDVKQKIQESLEKSRVGNKEYGFNFYLSDGKLITTDVVEGDEESLKIKDKKPRKAKLVGAFHVHTRLTNNDVIPSPGDIKKGVTEDFNFFCVGASLDEHEIIRCFSKGDLEEEMREIFQELGFEKNREGIERSSKLIVGKMTADKDYLEGHSHKKILKRNRQIYNR